MKLTLLEIVQSVLNSMDSDSVNNIDDTIESLQVADVAREVYYELMSYNDWEHLYEWRELEPLSDSNYPNFLRIPDDVGHMELFKYETTREEDDKRTFSFITYVSPKDFMTIVHNRGSNEDNILTIKNHNNVEMFIRNDRAPQYWTSFDDEHIVTDSYDSEVDSTLQSHKTSAWCRVTPKWDRVNTFIPDMPEEFFSAYLAEVKSTCHLYFKQQLSQKDEQIARRGLAHVRRKERFDKGRTWLSYGRKGPFIRSYYFRP